MAKTGYDSFINLSWRPAVRLAIAGKSTHSLTMKFSYFFRLKNGANDTNSWLFRTGALIGKV